MHLSRAITRLTPAMALGQAFAMPTLGQSSKGYNLLNKRISCENGQYLLYSFNAEDSKNSYAYCIATTTAAAIAVAVGGILGTSIYSAATGGKCTTPIDVSVPAQGAGSSKRDDGELKAKRQSGNLDGYNFEFYHGYDSHSCDHSDLPQSAWQDALNAAMEYMQDYDDECIVTTMSGANNDYVGQITIWIDTDDGVDHRTCG